MPRAKQPNPASNRTDLLTPSGPPRAMEAPDQAYGRVTAQAQSQRILPVGPQATATAPTPATPRLPRQGRLWRRQAHPLVPCRLVPMLAVLRGWNLGLLTSRRSVAGS